MPHSERTELWAPSQLEKALALLERNNRSEFGTALVLYMHGWNNSAAQHEDGPESGTIFEFRELLSGLSVSSGAARVDSGRFYTTVGYGSSVLEALYLATVDRDQSDALARRSQELADLARR